MKPGVITVGTLLALAQKAGLDLSPWRNAALARLQPALPAGTAAPVLTAPLQQQQRAMHVSALALVPEKREWLLGTYALRGALTLVVGPGGYSKSTLLLHMLLSCTSGRSSILDAHVFGGKLTGLYLSAEDGTAEVTLRVRAGMQHQKLTDADVGGLYVIGSDKWGRSLLSGNGGIAELNQQGWAALDAELDCIKPDILFLDPVISLMGGVDGNNNSAAALLMSALAKLAAERRMAIVLAHHAGKGRDTASAESALGAVSFVNLARIVLTIDPISEKDAINMGVPAWEAYSIFRILGVKQNYSPADAGKRLFRRVSVQINNAKPPTYPTGDQVGAIEVFKPGTSKAAYDPALVRDALTALDAATPPLSPSKNATGRYAADAIAAAIAPHRGGAVSAGDAEGLLRHIISCGLAAVQRVKIARSGGRADERNGLVVTPQGKAAMQLPAAAQVAKPAIPQSPQQSRGNNAGACDGGAPKRPRNVAGGCGGNAGGKDAGASGVNIIKNSPQAATDATDKSGAGELPVQTINASADSAAAKERALRSDALASVVQVPQGTKAGSNVHEQNANDDLSIPPYLDRRTDRAA
jgi:AAA domain